MCELTWGIFVTSEKAAKVIPELTEWGSVFDISPVLHHGIAVFPGDLGFSRSVSLDCSKGAAFTLSSITTTVHVGAHTDAPNHYHGSGKGIESRSLDYYLGLAQVIPVNLPRGKRILNEHITHAVKAPRVLFKTGSFPNPNQWNDDFNALSAEVIENLASQGVRLVGIDTPSIDLASDKVLESHHAVYRSDMAVLEGIVLDAVGAGLYQLIALPLPILEGDASPVRAVLVQEHSA
jgi:arylformamidase